MTMSNGTVAERWANGLSGTGSHMFSDGLAVFSYGYHFPIAVWLDEGRTRAAFCDYPYSITTQKHQGHVRSSLGYDLRGKTVSVSQKDMQEVWHTRRHHPEKDVIIVKAERWLGDRDPLGNYRG